MEEEDDDSEEDTEDEEEDRDDAEDLEQLLDAMGGEELTKGLTENLADIEGSMGGDGSTEGPIEDEGDLEEEEEIDSDDDTDLRERMEGESSVQFFCNPILTGQGFVPCLQLFPIPFQLETSIGNCCKRIENYCRGIGNC